MNDVRPIDANALLKRRRNFGKDYALDPVDKNIDDQLVDLRDVLNAPTLDYAPVVLGEWIPVDEETPCDEWDCTACGERRTFDYRMDYDEMKEFYRFCPSCGAKMDGGKSDG